MAGGKETPRQKMIGMMYLVLTALLALNVSKSILDAFVAIEENIQKANLTELYRGNEKRSELSEVAADKSNIERSKKAAKYLEVVERIDEITTKRIKLIDDIKLEILKECGEDISSTGEQSIITTTYSTKDPCRPARMNLDLVSGKDKYDDPMRILLGDLTDIKKPTGRGMDIWKSLLSYRKEITEIIASTRIIVEKDESLKFDKQFFFKAPSINEFKNPKDLDNKILNSINSSKVHEEDKEIIREIYRSLSKEEYSTVHDVPGVHWIGKTFDHSPSVAALASLSSLQKDILAARAMAISHIRRRVGGGDYSFNTILPVAYGPEVVNQGEEFTVSVLMAAFDTDKQPRVTVNGENVSDVRDGRGFVKMTGSSGQIELKGTVAIQNKQGIWNEKEWSKTITVMKPSGSIELPGMNTLYRGYDNYVNATASGYPTTKLNGQNVTISKSGDQYIVRPGSGSKAYLTVSGTSPDGTTVQLKRSEYTVRRLPSASLYWGSVIGKEKPAPSSNLLRAQYPEEIPLNAKFDVLTWEAEALGGRNARASGSGGNLAELRGIYNNVPSGTRIMIKARVKRPDDVIEVLTGIWIRQ